jgi:histone chaperone ASF1
MQLIPKKDLLGVTVVILYAAYRGSDFFKIGYYVNNEGPEDASSGKKKRWRFPVLSSSPTSASDIKRDMLMSKAKALKMTIDWIDK